jgi:arginase
MLGGMMKRPIVIVGAPSSIGIRPYDDGKQRRLDHAPAVLREQGIVDRLAAQDSGDLEPPPYTDFERPPGRARNEEAVGSYSRALADRIAQASADNAFVLVLGGDCSIVLGCLLGIKRPHGAPVGLVYVDAHADFATTQESRTGSVASMCLAMAVGRGDSPLARLAGDAPLARLEDVVIIGRRDLDESYYGEDVLRASPILDLTHAMVRAQGTSAVASAALERLTRPELAGFWIHVDADVIDPAEVPAVDSPEPGGLTIDEMTELLLPLVQHPKALGLELTIYDPALDADRRSAANLAKLLERVLVAWRVAV